MSVHRLMFAVIVVGWTWLLVKPNPVPAIIVDSLLDDLKFILSKGLHFGAYAFLAWYGTYRLTKSRWKWLWFFLIVHAIGTEIGQYLGNEYYQTHRHGCVMDVLIDSAGVLLGAWQRRRIAA